MVRLILLGLVLASGWAVCAMADDAKHLGVATCASSNCHGNVARQTNGNVWLNEYRIWRAHDYHSRAYNTLNSQESRSIVQKLGLKSATTADICLDCHADNVPSEQRGSEFQISDGVSCEACHGGAEQWIDTHDNVDVSHSDNVANGLYPTEQPAPRARLCLQCHMGAMDRFATHRILGAGHPRLSFELETFTVNQPPHFSVDEDYRRRKGETSSVGLWITGQLEAGRRYLQILQSGYFETGGWFPEFAFYDCQGCHHGLDPEDLRWYPERRQQGIEPGSLRLQDHHFRVLAVISNELTANETAELQRRVNALIAAGQSGRSAVVEAAQGLERWIDRRQAEWRGISVSNPQVRAMRKALVTQAASGREVDYGTAEQGLLSIVTLTAYLGENESLGSAIDNLFDALGNDETFRPRQYAAAARQVAGSF